MAEEQPVPPDPLRTTSMSRAIAISTFLLIATTVWAIYDEGVHKRPYIEFQDQWIERFGKHLDKVEADVKAREAELQSSPELQALRAKAAEIAKSIEPEQLKIEAELNEISRRLKAMDYRFRDSKGQIDEFVNRIESAEADDKPDLRTKLTEFRTKKFKVEFADGEKEYDSDSLIGEYLKLKETEGRLQGRLGQISAPRAEAQRAVDAFVSKAIGSTSSAGIASMRSELDGFEKGIKQIHVSEMGELVDRCESCHVGIRKTLQIRPEDMGGDDMARAFVNHPNPELLTIHDPERFGCSPCHNGNGVAVISKDKAHGHYKHWLWPMPKPENIEAGCVQCHTRDLVINYAPVLNSGKEIFRQRGCWGCHRYEGFEPETDELTLLGKDFLDLAAKEDRLRSRTTAIAPLPAAISNYDPASAPLTADQRNLVADVIRDSESIARDGRESLATAVLNNQPLADEQKSQIISALQSARPAISQELSALDIKREAKLTRQHDLLLETKKVGPSLKEVKVKLNPEWLPGWVKDPAHFRPDTKMPTYTTLDDKKVEQISAFIWSRGVDATLPKQEAGDAARGELLVRDRGCLACHSAKVDNELVGNNFAANLTRVGEKAKYDYLVRWVSNPKQKTFPYSMGLKRDLTEKDFPDGKLPADLDHPDPRWPKEWGTLLTHQMTVMPNLRLSPQDARDIASYLMVQKQDGASYPDAAAVVNASAETIAAGEKLVKHYGCAGCHEIAGLEGEQRIGTELTKEGSKPIERLDFGLLTHDAKHGGIKDGWYNPKGFFDHKLKNPQVFDHGKELMPTPDGMPTGLKMPNFRFSDQEITAVSTFLLGSVESAIPARFMYAPQDQRKAIQEGWWVVKKYNCVGCHAFEPGDVPALWTQPWFTTAGRDMDKFTDGNGEVHSGGNDRRPPTLAGEGARVDPQWLAEFLRNPALSKTNVYRNGVRTFLNVRMPTYDLSEGEIGKLVRFFNAMSDQPIPYVRPEQTPLKPEEAAAARALLAKECAKCHATGDSMTFGPDVNAPSFHHAQARLRPAWIARLVSDPQLLLPGTNMPPFFKFMPEENRWVRITDLPPELQAHKGDHIQLMTRFLAQYNNPGISAAK